MSSLTGHRLMTKTAVRELIQESPNDPLLSNLGAALLPNHAILRDIYDVFTAGHWLNFGQKHHFMRRFDGQKPFSAYQENVEWIRSNALSASRKLQERIQSKFKPMAGGTPAAKPGGLSPEQKLGGKLVFDGGDGDGVSWQTFGNACHALQDSFAGGHTVRRYVQGGPPNDSGMIADVLVYADDEDYKKSHHELDEAWHTKVSDTQLSDLGVLAKNGTKELIRLVVGTAMRAGVKSPERLDGWPQFCTKWLAFDPDLVTLDPDKAIRLVRRFSTGTANGLPGVGRLTFNMDEEGLANAIYREFGTSTRDVAAVFSYLQSVSLDTDSDDVAEYYVNLVKKNKGEVMWALTDDPGLVRQLIEILEAGWTSSGERDCITYLEGLMLT